MDIARECGKRHYGVWSCHHRCLSLLCSTRLVPEPATRTLCYAAFVSGHRAEEQVDSDGRGWLLLRKGMIHYTKMLSVMGLPALLDCLPSPSLETAMLACFDLRTSPFSDKTIY